MNVRLGYMRNAQSFSSGGGDVRVDIPNRVDNDRITGHLTTDEVTRLCEG